jgi:predicted TIM-barrel fold metal-dependent hydrolase
VRIASFAFEQPQRLAQAAGEIFMFGSDYPHPEGLANPIPQFSVATGLAAEDAPALYCDNARWLLHGAL